MRRMIIICMICALAASSFTKSSTTMFQLKESSAPNNYNSTTVSTSFLFYNDTRPVAPNGFLCVFGAKGRLNNLILQNLVGIYMAHHLNRTLLVDPEVSKYYDIDSLSLAIYPESPYLAAMPIEKSDHTCKPPQQISPHTINHALTILERFDDYNKQTKGRSLASVDNNDAWYWLGRPPENIYKKFFTGLIPRQVYRDQVHHFMQEHDLLQNPYNALHLRYFEGRCGHVDLDLCCPKLTHVQMLLLERDGSIINPLFVANDRQCPEDVLRSYINATDPVIMGYDRPCHGTECAVLDFELCVQADIFVGNLKSSGDMNIREWRLARYDKPGRTSVLSRQPETMAMEKRTTFMTRYVMGHWRFRPDCSEVAPGQRSSKPCV
ncbi:hypothetical protein ACHAXR_002877 [Thalassiosira sp. AJA248-18]